MPHNSSSLSNICLFTCVTGECVYAAFIVFSYMYMWFWFCELVQRVCASECNAYVRVFEEVGYLSYCWGVVGKDCPFFVFVSLFLDLCFWLCL